MGQSVVKDIGLLLNETIDEYLEAKRKVKELIPLYEEKGNTYWKMLEEILGKPAVFMNAQQQEKFYPQNPDLKSVKDEWDAIEKRLHPLWKKTSVLKERIGDLAIEKRESGLAGKRG